MRVKKRDWKKYRRLFILIAITILWLVIAVCSVVDLVKNEKAQNNGEDVSQAGNESPEPFCSPVLVIDEPAETEQPIAVQYNITQSNVPAIAVPGSAKPTPEQINAPTAEPTASTTTEPKATPEPTPIQTVSPTSEPAQPTSTPTPKPTATSTQEVTTPQPEESAPTEDNGSNDSAPDDSTQTAWIEKYEPMSDSLVTQLGNIIDVEVEAYISTLPRERALQAYKLLGSTVLHRLDLGICGHTTVKGVIYCRRCFGTHVSTTKRTGVPECYEIAEMLLREGPIGPRNLIFAAPFPQGEIYDVFDDGRWVTYFGCNPDYPAE